MAEPVQTGRMSNVGKDHGRTIDETPSRNGARQGVFYRCMSNASTHPALLLLGVSALRILCLGNTQEGHQRHEKNCSTRRFPLDMTT